MHASKIESTMAAGAAALLLLACTLPAAAAGKVEVQFNEPEKYVDAGWSSFNRERTLSALGDYMKSLATQLPDGQTLQLEVLDIDLAGRVNPTHFNEVRVMTGRADWPHITLRYTLQAGGSTLKAGQADLADPNYLYSGRIAGIHDGEFAYEKRMLQRWFSQTLVAPAH